MHFFARYAIIGIGEIGGKFLIMTEIVIYGAVSFMMEVEMGVFDWLFGDSDDEDAQLDDILLMDTDDEGE